MGSAVRPEAAEIIKKKRSAVVSNAHLCMTLSEYTEGYINKLDEGGGRGIARPFSRSAFIPVH
jgi:hypothetical protein